MKWMFIIFLLLNVCYFGWELDKQTLIEVKNSVRPFEISANTQRLKLLSELKSGPDSTPITFPAARDENNAEDEFSNNMHTPLQNITSMMEQGDVMIEKKVIDELLSNIFDFSTKNIPDNGQDKNLCVSFGPFAEKKQADELSKWLQEKEIQTKQRGEGGKQDQYFWIYLSASESKDEAMVAIEDLKGKGVQDYKLINNGNLQNAISLGLFSSQSAVNKRLNELKNIGYQPVVVPYHKSQSIMWVDVMVEAKVDAKGTKQNSILSEFINGYPSRFNSIPVNCEGLFIALDTE